MGMAGCGVSTGDKALGLVAGAQRVRPGQEILQALLTAGPCEVAAAVIAVCVGHDLRKLQLHPTLSQRHLLKQERSDDERSEHHRDQARIAEAGAAGGMQIQGPTGDGL